jgi:uncharacterized coiled-coil DUF342 family protein
LDENCKDCPYVQNLKDDIKSLKTEVKDLDERVIVVEKFSASGGEQIKMIFKMLNEIKCSIDKIGNKLEDINKNAVNSTKVADLEKKIEEIKYKPAEDYSKIKVAIVTSVCTGIIGVILGIIFTKN